MRQWWEVALGVAVAGLGMLLWLVIIPREVKVVASETGEISPAFFPSIVAWSFIVLGLVHAAIALLRDTMAPASAASAGAGDGALERMPRALAVFAMGIGYLVLLPGIGFLPATVLAQTALILFLGDGPWWRAPVIAAPFAWCLFLLFGKVLQIPLPRAGWLE